MCIVFLGTPGFAAHALRSICEAGYEVVAVVTAPDKPAGRGKKIREPEVKKYAARRGLRILQPQNLKNPDFIDEFRSLNADLGVVVAFRMLPEAVWSAPRLGTINLHASLLPHYRGAAPINHVIINGETQTGVTTFFLKHQIDTGNIILRETVNIEPDETAGDLHDKLMHKGAKLLLKTISSVEEGNYTLTNQQDFMKYGEQLKTAPKIFREDCRINWSDYVQDIYNFIRGLSPYPGAYGFLLSPDNKTFKLKIIEAYPEITEHKRESGNILLINNKKTGVFVPGGIIYLQKVQLEGKKALNVHDFLNGFPLTEKWKMI